MRTANLVVPVVAGALTAWCVTGLIGMMVGLVVFIWLFSLGGKR